MIDAEKLLGGLLGSNSRKRRGGLGSLLSSGAAMGALGVAMEAFEHFVNQPSDPGNAGASGKPPPPPGSAPPPPPGKLTPGAAPPPPTPGKITAGAAPPPPPPPGKAAVAVPPPASGSTVQEDAVLLIRAMIAAANADGVIDQEERNRILERLQDLDLSAEEQAFITRELLAPADLETIVGAVHSPGLATQVYTVSLMAIEVDTDMERHYMETLAARLGLDAATVAGIQQRLARA